MKGDVAALNLPPLKPLPPANATLEIRSGTPDAEVFVDNNARALGKLNSTGDLASPQISAGKHRIQLRKSDFEDSQVFELDFIAGGTKSLSGPQVTLRPYGWIDFNVLPANSRITYSPIGGTGGPLPAKNGDGTRLKAGRYSIGVVNSNTGQAYAENVEVEAGRGQSFNKTSWPPPSSGDSAPRPTIYDKSIVDSPTAQIPFSLSQKQVPGTYSFRIKLRGFPTRKRAKWVANFRDNKNYVEYEIDEKSLKYTVHENGGARPGKPIPHSVSADSYDIAVDVGANAISVFIGGQRSPIDTPSSGGNLLAGKFGFPKEENWDNFQFTTPAR
jgi:hypothetical protein